ncbi:mannosyltransferase family protein [Leifsonia sp. 22587]|uniref:mannosyltransferase family protein n=1 Tax=Leifsonia sp. 22587 TaxID=3453946 RepID=UPI003F87F277
MPGSRVQAPADAPGTEAVDRHETGRGAWWASWWVRVLAVYLASRVVTTVILLIFAATEGPNAWTSAGPDYFSFANIWDGRWYEIVAVSGYPAALPTSDGVHVSENAWAFMPGYPGVVDAVMFLTRAPWPVAAVLVSFLAGAGAALVFHRLMRRVGLSPSQSLFAVVLFCVAPVAPLFQVAYAESLYILLLAVALLLLVERRYGWLFPVVLAMAVIRPSGLAFALALALHVGYRWFRRREDPFPARERILSVSLTIFSGLAGLAWPAVAAIGTGSLTAYTDTELAWRAPYIGYTDLLPFTPWFQGADWWASAMLGLPGWVGVVVLIVLVALFAVLLFSPAVRRLGVDLRFWIAAYSVYLLAVFFPQSSTFRLLMPLFPLLGAMALPRSRVYRVGMVALFVALQVGWVAVCWSIDGYDWSPP